MEAMSKITGLKNRLRRKEAGASASEYAILAGLIGVVAIALLASFGGSVSDLFTQVSGALVADADEPGTGPVTEDPEEDPEDPSDAMVLVFANTDTAALPFDQCLRHRRHVLGCGILQPGPLDMDE